MRNHVSACVRVCLVCACTCICVSAREHVCVCACGCTRVCRGLLRLQRVRDDLDEEDALRARQRQTLRGRPGSTPKQASSRRCGESEGTEVPFAMQISAAPQAAARSGGRRPPRVPLKGSVDGRRVLDAV